MIARSWNGREGIALCLSAPIAGLVRMLRARRQDQARTAQPRLAMIARWVGLIAAALSAVTMVCLVPVLLECVGNSSLRFTKDEISIE